MKKPFFRIAVALLFAGIATALVAQPATANITEQAVANTSSEVKSSEGLPDPTTPVQPRADFLASDYPQQIALSFGVAGPERGSPDPMSSITITWFAKSGRGAVFEYKKADGSASTTTLNSLTTTPIATGETYAERAKYVVNLDNLEQGTKYLYRIQSGTNWTNWYAFQTEDPTATSFTFIHVTDPQMGRTANSDGKTNLQSATAWGELLNQAVSTVGAENIAFMINTGDCVNSEDNSGSSTMSQQHMLFFTAAQPFLASYAHMISPGNNDINRGRGRPQDETYGTAGASTTFRDHHTLPDNGATGHSVTQQTTHFFDYGNTRFISMNTGMQTHRYPATSNIEFGKAIMTAQLAWLEELLIDANQPDNGIDWKVVMLHEMPVGAFAGNNYPREDRHTFYADMRILFRDYGVDLALVGDEHYYFRSKRVCPVSLDIVPDDTPGGMVFNLPNAAAFDFEPIPGDIATHNGTAKSGDIFLPTFSAVTVSADKIEVSAYTYQNAVAYDNYTINYVLFDYCEHCGKLDEFCTCDGDAVLLVALKRESATVMADPGNKFNADEGIYADVSELTAWDNNQQIVIGSNGSTERTPIVINNAETVTTNGWQPANEVGIDDATAFQLKFSTKGHEDITFSCTQKSTGSGPDTFRLAYRIGSTGSFTPVENSLVHPVRVSNDSYDALQPTYDEFSLPITMSNQDVVYLRIYFDGANGLGRNGNTSINDIKITAVPVPFDSCYHFGHDAGAWHTTLAATCEVAGSEDRRCTRCQHVLETRPITALGHDLPANWTERTPATCDNAGVEFKKCTRCDHEETQTIPKLTGTQCEQTNITEIETDEGLEIYPNPVNYELWIMNDEWQPGDIIELFDINGRRVYMVQPPFTVDRVPFTIDISHLPEGTYVLRIGSRMAKIVKQ